MINMPQCAIFCLRFSTNRFHRTMFNLQQFGRSVSLNHNIYMAAPTLVNVHQVVRVGGLTMCTQRITYFNVSVTVLNKSADINLVCRS